MTRGIKTFFIATLVLLVFLAASFAYGIFKIKEMDRSATNIMNEANKAERDASLAQSIRSIRDSSRGTGAALDDIALTDSELALFLDSLEAMGERLGLEVAIASVAVDNPKAEASPKALNIAIETKGALDENISYLRALENLPTAALIKNFTLRSDEGGADLPSASSSAPSVWQASSVITIYTFSS